jgi:hypothetical protein
MFEYEHAITTSAAATALWRLWSDVSLWPHWNPDVSAATIDGPFTQGSHIAMTLASGDVIDLTLCDVLDGTSFTDEATLDGIVVRTVHRLDPQSDGTVRVVYATTVSGEAPSEVLTEIGTGITADFPDTVQSLVAHAAVTV